MKLKSPKLFFVIAFVTFLMSGCASTTVITSYRIEKYEVYLDENSYVATVETKNIAIDNAEVYIDGELIGETPYTHTDKRKWGSSTLLQIDKAGYHSYYGRLSKGWFSGYQDTVKVIIISEGQKSKGYELDSKNQGQTK
ncbi:MAG: hypothetical protein ABFS16_06950 [Bacteroidota bacterium]